MSLHPWNYYSTPPRRKIGAVLARRHRLLLRGPLEAVCLPLTTTFDHIRLCSAHSLPNPSPTPHSFSTFFSTTDSGVSPCAIGHDRIATPVDHWVGFFDIREFFSVFEAASVGPTPSTNNERDFLVLFIGKAQPMGVLGWRRNHANLNNIVLFWIISFCPRGQDLQARPVRSNGSSYDLHSFNGV